MMLHEVIIITFPSGLKFISNKNSCFWNIINQKRTYILMYPIFVSSLSSRANFLSYVFVNINSLYFYFRFQRKCRYLHSLSFPLLDCIDWFEWYSRIKQKTQSPNLARMNILIQFSFSISRKTWLTLLATLNQITTWYHTCTD